MNDHIALYKLATIVNKLNGDVNENSIGDKFKQMLIRKRKFGV